MGSEDAATRWSFYSHRAATGTIKLTQITCCINLITNFQNKTEIYLLVFLNSRKRSPCPENLLFRVSLRAPRPRRNPGKRMGMATTASSASWWSTCHQAAPRATPPPRRRRRAASRQLTPTPPTSTSPSAAGALSPRCRALRQRCLRATSTAPSPLTSLTSINSSSELAARAVGEANFVVSSNFDANADAEAGVSERERGTRGAGEAGLAAASKPGSQSQRAAAARLEGFELDDADTKAKYVKRYPFYMGVVRWLKCALAQSHVYSSLLFLSVMGAVQIQNICYFHS